MASNVVNRWLNYKPSTIILLEAITLALMQLMYVFAHQRSLIRS